VQKHSLIQRACHKASCIHALLLGVFTGMLAVKRGITRIQLPLFHAKVFRQRSESGEAGVAARSHVCTCRVLIMHVSRRRRGPKYMTWPRPSSAFKCAEMSRLAQQSMARSTPGQRWRMCGPGVIDTYGRNVRTRVWAELQSDDFRS